MEIVELLQEHFPKVKIVARARDVTHWNRLREKGVTHVERELFESSLRSGRSVLEMLGHPPHEARMLAAKFRQHNIAMVDKMFPHFRDQNKLIAVAKEARAQLEQQMTEDRAAQAERSASVGQWKP
jgi:glutathione-regulated potassium-efflux system ancillary protein KefC